MDKTIVVEGFEKTQAVRHLAQLHFWRSQAQMKIKFNMSPRKGWTIRTFNTMYETNAKSWQDVYNLTNDTIISMRQQ